VVGSRYDDDNGSNSGSAYVFRTTDGGVTYGQVAKLTASDAYSDDNFGWSVRKPSFFGSSWCCLYFQLPFLHMVWRET